MSTSAASRPNGRVRLSAIIVASLLVAGAVTSCQVVKLGARCKTKDLQEDGGAWVMKCEKGRWRRAITKADAARILLALQPTTTTTAPAAPATTAAPDVPVTAAPPAVVPTVPPTVPPTTAPAATDLDLTFGNQGRLTITVPAAANRRLGQLQHVVPTVAGLYVFVQSQPITGTIVGAYGTTIVRLRADGTPDPAFSDDGVLDLAMAYTATADTAGRVYAAENPRTASTVRRLTTAGVPDTTFGTGEITYDAGPGCGYPALTALTDGSVVAWQQNSACAMHRFLGNGSHAAWGDLSSLPTGATVGSVTAGPAGSAYLRTGTTMSFAGSNDVVMKFASSGAPDPAFGTNGVMSPPSGVGHPTEMAVLTDGSMVFFQGGLMSFNGAAMTVQRVLPNGSLVTGGGFAGGTATIEGHTIAPLPGGGFFSSWWKSNNVATHTSYSDTAEVSPAFSGVTGTGKVEFDGGNFLVNTTVPAFGRLVTVIDRGHTNPQASEATVIEIVRFAQTV